MASDSADERARHKRFFRLTGDARRRYIAAMKWRNQLLALVCLLAFLGLGVLYFKNWVVQKPFGIIVFIGEGLDPTRLAAARIYAAGADNSLAMDSLNFSALLKNYSANSAVPDPAAAASALATGEKVKNGALAVDGGGRALVNLLELAHHAGRMTGLVTDGRLTSPTAAAFYAHTTEKDDRLALARELVEKAKVDVVLGGGGGDFLPATKGGLRTDERDLVQEMQEANYDFVQTSEELEEVPRWRRARLFGVFSNEAMAFADDDVARVTQPALSDMVRRAIELLQFNREGYLLIVDASLMRKAAQANDAERTLGQTIELDRAVSTALEYTGRNSAVYVCGDVGWGGMSLNGFVPRDRTGAVWLESSGWASLTWATGPNGPKESQTPAPLPLSPPEEANPAASPAILELRKQPAAIYAETSQQTANDTLLLGNGLGAEEVHGIMESTRFFEILRGDL